MAIVFIIPQISECIGSIYLKIIPVQIYSVVIHDGLICGHNTTQQECSYLFYCLYIFHYSLRLCLRFYRAELAKHSHQVLVL